MTTTGDFELLRSTCNCSVYLIVLVTEVKMSVVDEFLASPSYALLEQCSKEQLIKIAEHYSISLTSDDKRLKESLFKAVGPGS